MRTQPTPIESILQVCVTGMLENNLSLEHCLAQYPGQRAELEPLLKLASRLQAARSLRASSDFRMSAPARMRSLIAARAGDMNAGAVHPRRAAHSGGGHAADARRAANSFTAILQRLWPDWALPTHRQLAIGRAAAALFILLLLTFSMASVQASVQALPGDRLYTLKTSMEAIRLNLSWHDFQDAELHMEYAGTRIQEADRLRQHNRASRAVEPLQQYNIEINTLSSYYETSTPLTMDEQTVLAGRILAMLDSQEHQLMNWLPDAPSELQQALRDSLSMIQAAHQAVLKYLQTVPNHPIRLTLTPPVIPTPPASTPVPPTKGIPGWLPTGLPEAIPTVLTRTLPTPFPWDLWKWATTYPVPGQGTYLPPPLPTNWQEYIPTYLPTYLPTLWPDLISTPVVPTLPVGWPTDWEEFPTPSWPTGVPDTGDDPDPPRWLPLFPTPKPPSIQLP